MHIPIAKHNQDLAWIFKNTFLLLGPFTPHPNRLVEWVLFTPPFFFKNCVPWLLLLFIQGQSFTCNVNWDQKIACFSREMQQSSGMFPFPIWSHRSSAFVAFRLLDLLACIQIII